MSYIRFGNLVKIFNGNPAIKGINFEIETRGICYFPRSVWMRQDDNTEMPVRT